MKARVIAAALVFCSSAVAEKDFFGLLSTPVPTPGKPAGTKPIAAQPAGDAAADKDAGTPGELAALKQRYEEEAATATKPTRDRYAAALQMLLRSLIQKSDLSGVRVVQNELSSVTGTKSPNSPGQSTGAENDSKQPPEFTALKQRYEQDLVARSKAARDRYANALQGLLRATMQKGDLVVAATVKAELDNARPPALSEKDEMKKTLLTSCWWQIRDVTLEFTPDGRLIRHGDAHGWDGKSWKLAADGKGVECTYANGQMETYLFKSGGLAHFDPSWGQFKKVPKK